MSSRMWWAGKKKKRTSVPPSVTEDGVPNERVFHQIVRVERARAEASGTPMTLVVLTVRCDTATATCPEEDHRFLLCQQVRTTVHITDHVGIAGPRQIGVVLWNTREHGAYRFVNRLDADVQQTISDCRLYVFPVMSADPAGSDPVSELASTLGNEGAVTETALDK